jgi:hypothetical protein
VPSERIDLREVLHSTATFYRHDSSLHILLQLLPAPDTPEHLRFHCESCEHTDMSLTMEDAFYRHMKDLTSEDYVEVEKPKAPKKKKGGHALAA